MAPLDVRFFRATVSPGDRATLVWNRRSTGCFTAGCGSPHALTLSNLDLYEYDGSQSLQASSTSSLDNVEQVRAPVAGTAVYKVKDQSSTIDGASIEPFAFAAADAITPLTAPRPTVTLTLDRTSVHQNEPVTMTARVVNPSSDMAGSSAQLTVSLPPGVLTTSGGSSTWSIGALSAGASPTHQWTIEGTVDAIQRITATAQDQAYGETLTSPQASASLTVDSTPPAATIACPRGQVGDARLPVSWTATDASGVSRYDVSISTDGGPFVPWLATHPPRARRSPASLATATPSP